MLHGASWSGVATVFPQVRGLRVWAHRQHPVVIACQRSLQNIAWGASLDVPLVAAVADIIAVEARAKWISGLAPDGSSQEFAGLSFMCVCAAQNLSSQAQTHDADCILPLVVTGSPMTTSSSRLRGGAARRRLARSRP